MAEYQKRKMAMQRKKPTQRFANSFAKRITSSTRNVLSDGQDSASFIGNPFSGLEGEETVITADYLHSLPLSDEIRHQRMIRATMGRFNQLVVLSESIDEQMLVEKSVTESTNIEELSKHADQRKREAQDRLLLNQLDSGMLPELFIKPGGDPRYVAIDLLKYGIGDQRGLCLAHCLKGMDNLQSLGLSDNRLTHISLPRIIENISPANIMHLDLSFNAMGESSSQELGALIDHGASNILYLNLSNCGLKCSDMKNICSALRVSINSLEEFVLAGNSIAGEGAADICSYLGSRFCKLKTLDLSWNTIGEDGAVELSKVLGQNKTLTSLNLASNNLGGYDKMNRGVQRLLNSLKDNKMLDELDLSQNGVTSYSCFVLAKMLKDHPTLRRIVLSLNPLGEAGARSMFRSILRGLKCWIIMRNCFYQEIKEVFDYTYPSMQNPYQLDLSEPYQRAVFIELLTTFLEHSESGNFEDLVYRESPKSPDIYVNLVVNNNEIGAPVVCNKATGLPYEAPESGIVRFQFQQAITIPDLSNKIKEDALNTLQTIIENGATEEDKRHWLALLCQDIYMTTSQAQQIIDRFKKNRTIGIGGLTVIDIMQAIWIHLLDTENMFDFMYFNIHETHERRELVLRLTMKGYKFNWFNPTNHWRLNLGSKFERNIMMKLIAINNFESEFSRLYSGRGDTSQNGNWFNFRNERLVGDTSEKVFLIDKDFVKQPPMTGIVEFDYVSTMRPHVVEEEEDVDTNEPAEDNESVTSGDSKPPSTRGGSSSRRRRSLGSIKQSEILMKRNDNKAIKVITDDELYEFMNHLGLSSRSKASDSEVMYVLMDLQLYSTKYYFTVAQVLTLLDAFGDKDETQASVMVTMFSRIVDLHNLDYILRNMRTTAQKIIAKKLGYLNIINPLKISFDYELPLKHRDNRALLLDLIDLSSAEKYLIKEHANSELPISYFYGPTNRTINEPRKETIRCTYLDFDPSKINVQWSYRQNLTKKFLVGTQPVSNELFKIIDLYKELEAANALTTGPLDLQHANYLKSLKSNSLRVSKANKDMVNLMRGSYLRKSLS